MGRRRPRHPAGERSAQEASPLWSGVPELQPFPAVYGAAKRDARERASCQGAARLPRAQKSNVKFPEEYQAEELAGKDATFKIKLHEVQYKELPELDDDFAKDVSEYDTLDELKDSIRKGIETNHEKQADQKVENDLIDQVVGGMKAEIPDAMIESRIEELVQDFQYRISQQGLKLEQYLQYMGMTMEQFKEQFREQADKQVKMRLAMEAIVAKESIEATEEEFEAEIKRIADQYKMEEKQVRDVVNMDDLKNDLAVTKAIDFIKSHANIVEKAAEAEKAADAE